jgi:dynactin complex subunit
VLKLAYLSDIYAEIKRVEYLNARPWSYIDLASREVDSFQWTAEVMEEENGGKRESLFIISIIILLQVLTLYLIVDLQHNFNIVYNYI